MAISLEKTFVDLFRFDGENLTDEVEKGIINVIANRAETDLHTKRREILL